MSYADYETDLEIEKYFDLNYIGVCLDIGAGLGTERNNSYYFEKKYWRCLCIEPNPKLYNFMRMYRRLAINIACSSYDKKDVQFHVYNTKGGDQESISLLVADQRLLDSHKEVISGIEGIKVEVKKLDSLLAKVNLEKIDFVSICTGGAELEILNGFDINRWSPKLFVIGNSLKESNLSDYLGGFGYIFSQRIGTKDFFVKSSEEKRENTQKISDLDYIFEI